MKIYRKRFKAIVLKTFLTTVDKNRLRKQKYPNDDLDIFKDIPYINDANPMHRLDILMPKHCAPNAATIINVHGGGLIYGDKALNQNFNAELAHRGYRVVSLSYRLLPKCSFDEQIDDILAALQFIKTYSEEYALNLNRTYLVGDSAGGLLSLFAVALTRSSHLRDVFEISDPEVRIKGMGLISSMLDIGNRKDIIDYAQGLVLQGKKLPAEAFIYEPAKLFDELTFPPCFLVTSAEDFIRNDSLKLKRLFDQANSPCVLLDWPKGETNKLSHVFPVTYPKYPESQESIDGICMFFERRCT